ncbi:cytochrome c oxidase subunit II [Mesorhizobium sp. ZC-5]|uniref:cytochrome c oxidase subunit II n=1 Tax=Mesorhizobium sp. ZC-5 TaxID=2986066 RepID=UPI0021E7AE18|nr:cytochrome c oxidase subunit II [Mesorhizobium sp. ZC-5]MCV3241765.1 cytochrome c oxidase subunit II [Mesorhizobium sp. ZC-5]
MLTVAWLSGCSGIQSAIDPAGEEATHVATLFWVMTCGGALIWAGTVAVLLYAVRRRTLYSEPAASRLIFWAGAVFPAITLILLLGYALWLMPSLRPLAQPGAPTLRIEVTGRQYWWRVIYRQPGTPPVVSANEIRLPVGERVEFTLKSDDVIHSFWIPALGGKMDMIPGRENRLSLRATKPGTFRGPCTEFCGTSHALMAFSAVAMEPAEFRQWLAGQHVPSAGATGTGARLFIRHGCGACHAVAGTEATGMLGPDLSHLGSRETLGAGILPNSQDNIARFIAEPDVIKPGVQMPGFDMLPPDDIEAIASWLKGLK